MTRKECCTSEGAAGYTDKVYKITEVDFFFAMAIGDGAGNCTSCLGIIYKKSTKKKFLNN